jgi:hypothetical protein
VEHQILEKLRGYRERLLRKGEVGPAHTVEKCMQLIKGIPPARRRDDAEEFGDPETLPAPLEINLDK